MFDSRITKLIAAAAAFCQSRRRYRTWSREEKDRIVGDMFAPGRRTFRRSRAHGLDPSHIFAWRREALASGMMALSERATPVKFARLEPWQARPWNL